MIFKYSLKICLLCLMLIASRAPSLQAQEKPRVLVYVKVTGYAHASIPDGIKAVEKIAAENNFIADTTSKNTDFTEDNLKRYAAIVFISTNANTLDTAQRIEFERYIEAGGGFMGIHGASTGGKGWPWYVKLVGAQFVSHPEPKEGVLHVENADNESTRQYPDHMTWKDEWYNFTNIQSGLNLLLFVDEDSYVGGINGRKHPIAWYHDFDGGRSFYTALGHFSYHYTDVLFVKHIEGGLKYAMGNNVKLDYSKVSTPKYTGK